MTTQNEAPARLEMLIPAQVLYDERERAAAISGSDLHDLFRAVCGDPSPSGRVLISRDRLRAYAQELRETYAAHRATDGVGGQYLLDIAEFAAEMASM